MRGFVLISTAILMFVSQKGLCNQSFYKEHAKGWHWYETKLATPELVEPEERAKPVQKEERTAMTPTEKVAAIRKDAEGKLHKAMILPTEENVISYIKAQEEVADRSQKFSEVWERVVYKNPGIDRTLKHPVSSDALRIARKEELEHKRAKIRDLRNEYGLMYFFKGDCKYCQGFASVVKGFAEFYNWEVMPIQIGDVGLKEFPNAKKNNGTAENLGITGVPALIAVEPRTKKMIPLAYGYVKEGEIENRVNALVGSRR